jgi:preprotein translocase subunit SecA
MRIFASDRLDGMLKRLGLKEDEAIAHPFINKALERAQSKVEARNFEIRKNLLRFDNVMNDQRKVIYEQRREIMQTEKVDEMVTAMRLEVIEDMVTTAIPPNSYAEKWEIDTLKERVRTVLDLDLPVDEWGREEGIAEPEIEERIRTASNEKMAAKEQEFGVEVMRMAEKSLLLQLLDQHWKEHLLALDHLRQGITLRSYAQRDPLREYQQESFEMFQVMLTMLRESVARVLSMVQLRVNQPDAVPAPQGTPPQEMHEGHTDPALAPAGRQPPQPGARPLTRQLPPGIKMDPNDPATWGKIQRNAPCPCGSGKKYKHCHGVVAAHG